MKNRVAARNFLLFVGALALAAKCYLAWTTTGMSDTWYWLDFVHVARSDGALALYYKPYSRWTFFNHPPFMVHAAFLYGWLAALTSWPLAFWVRFPSIIADVGTLCVLWKMTFCAHSIYSTLSLRRLLWVAFCPASVLIFGFHGNTDAVMMFFAVLSLYFLVTEKPAWLIGLAFGMSISIKIVPLIFVPLMLLYLRTPRQRIEYSITALATCVVGGMPYLAQDAPFILARVFGYSGQYNNWGLSRLLGFMPPPLQFLNAGFESVGKYFLLFAIVALSWWMRRRGSSQNAVPIELQMATIVACFLVLTPAFGYQYLAWIVPFLPLWNARAIGFFTLCSALYLLSVYTFRWRTWSWYANTPWLIDNWKEHIVILETLCWSSVVVLFYLMLKKVAQMRTLSFSDGSQQ